MLVIQYSQNQMQFWDTLSFCFTSIPLIYFSPLSLIIRLEKQHTQAATAHVQTKTQSRLLTVGIKRLTKWRCSDADRRTDTCGHSCLLQQLLYNSVTAAFWRSSQTKPTSIWRPRQPIRLSFSLSLCLLHGIYGQIISRIFMKFGQGLFRGSRVASVSVVKTCTVTELICTLTSRM